MAKYTIISDVGKGILELLRDKLVPDVIDKTESIGICEPKERGGYIVGIHPYDIKEDTKGIPKSYRWDDIVYKMIPDVIGKTKKEAKKLLQGFNIEFTGDGDNVIDTSPNVNSRVKEGSTIKVLLN